MAFPREDRSDAEEMVAETPTGTAVIAPSAVNDNNNANGIAFDDSSRPPIIYVYSRRRKTTPESSSQVESAKTSVESKADEAVPDLPPAAQWTKLNFEEVDPKSLVGLTCKVYWHEDIEWYHGKVVKYYSKTKKHQVNYNDGDKEKLNLSKERIRFLVPPKK